MRATTTALVTFVVLAVLLAAPFAGLSATSLLVGAVAALAFVFGAFFAPASYRRGGPLFALSGSPAWERTKSLQLVVGGIVTYLAFLLFDQNPGTCAIFGIVAALAVGAVAGESERADR